jgi:YidC/Oxa1 family membrane protein insertase
MKLAVNENRFIEYRYAIKPGSYMTNFSIRLSGMNDIVTRDPSSLDMNWEIYIPQHEQQKKYENQYTSLYFRHHKEDVDFFKPRQSKEIQTQDIPTQVQWVAFKSQFFSSIILADNAFSSALLKSTNLPETDKFLKNFRTELGIPFQRLENETIHLNLFFGPNKFKLLKGYKNYELEDLVSVGRGIIRWINQYLIIPVFDWLSKFIGNFGIIILFLTIIIKILLLPLTYKSYLSQARMKVLKPQIDELTEKFPKGKEMERQQATMALYKRAGISPLGGCLPMLLQFPILFAMFRFFPTSIELRQEGFLWATDLSTFDSILSWDSQIPILSNLYGNHISLFTLLMTISTIIQMKLSDTSTTQQMPGMKTMMYIMPVMFMFMLNNFSAGLTYYYFLTNIITIGQNYLFKQFVDEKEILRKIEERKAKPVKKSKWQQRLEDMAKQKQVQRKPSKTSKNALEHPKKSALRPGSEPSRKPSKGK